MKENPSKMTQKSSNTKERKPKLQKSVSSKLRREAINWEPPYPEGEDDVSLQRHKECLQRMRILCGG
jgi:hypothetical protein